MWPARVTSEPAPPELDRRAVVEICSAAALQASRRIVRPLPELGLAVLVVATRRGPLAVREGCPHLGRSLCDARFGSAAVRCPGHGRTYRLAATGEPTGSRPVVRALRAWVEDGFVKVEIPPSLP
jgi:nitrite reductase/ring-hydroxylating ferredoxin subunit